MKRHPPDLVCRIVDGDGDIIVVDVDGVKNAATLFEPAHMAASSKQQIDRRILISVYYCLFFDVSLSPRYLSTLLPSDALVVAAMVLIDGWYDFLMCFAFFRLSSSEGQTQIPFGGRTPNCIPKLAYPPSKSKPS